MFAGITANEKTDAEEIYRPSGCTVRRRINFFCNIYNLQCTHIITFKHYYWNIHKNNIACQWGEWKAVNVNIWCYVWWKYAKQQKQH